MKLPFSRECVPKPSSQECCLWRIRELSNPGSLAICAHDKIFENHQIRFFAFFFHKYTRGCSVHFDNVKCIAGAFFFFTFVPFLVNPPEAAVYIFAYINVLLVHVHT